MYIFSLASSDSELLRWEAAITKYRVKAKMNLKPFLRDESNDWQIFVNMYIQVLQPTCMLVGEGGATVQHVIQIYCTLNIALFSNV